MFTDGNLKELQDFADTIAASEHWLVPHHKFPYYDIPEVKRRLALVQGATRKEIDVVVQAHVDSLIEQLPNASGFTPPFKNVPRHEWFMSYWKLAIMFRDVKRKYEREFYQTFKVRLGEFCTLYLGFDTVKFDDEFIKSVDGQSCRDKVVEVYGEDAAVLIERIMAAEQIGLERLVADEGKPDTGA